MGGKWALRCRTVVSLLIVIGSSVDVSAQRYLADFDSSFFIKDTVRPVIKRFENLRITGYMQPQFQHAQSDGVASFAGGNFSPLSRSRFMLRRARVKLDYLLPSKTNFPTALFSFQIDATERGVIVRDMFVKLFETNKNVFAVTTGLFARPFGYEVNLSSAFRETPERGRMSQILMPSERDIGIMVSFEPQEKNHSLAHIKLDAGFFNGQGLSGATDFDSHKDFISRLFVKPYTFGSFDLSGGLSLLRGGWINGTKYIYEYGTSSGGTKMFVVDSTVTNLGKSSPRHYYGADFQLKVNHGWGETEWRMEYWFGTQPGTSVSTSNPGSIPNTNGSPAPTYIRKFDGAFLLFLQNIVNRKNQLMVKYDWYDPNIHVSSAEIGGTATNFTNADIKFSTLGIGISRVINPQTKLILYYDHIRNESTSLSDYSTDIKDNILTCRLQFRF